jgi:hypothetical protein
MKAIPRGYYGLDIIAENDAEKVWLKQFIGGFSKDFINNCGTEITVDLESMCVTEDNRPAVDLTLREAYSDDSNDGAWGLVDKISLNACGL